MSVRNEIEEQVDFFVDKLCPQSQKMYHFAVMIFLNSQTAKKCLDETYELAADKIKSISKQENHLLELVKCCWSVSQKMEAPQVDEDLNISKILKDLTKEERAAFACVDILNISYPLTALSMGWNSNEIIGHLISARQKIIANN